MAALTGPPVGSVPCHRRFLAVRQERHQTGASRPWSPSLPTNPAASLTSIRPLHKGTRTSVRPAIPRRHAAQLKATAQEGPSSSSSTGPLKKGAAVIVVEEPPFVKTAEPMPMLKRNEGIVQKGDVGRILDSRPKDVWAVRMSTGAYLLDGKYLQALE